METLIDELAVRARTDPLAYRLRLLKPDARKLRGVLELLERKSTWRRNVPRDQGVGIACTVYEGTAVACAAAVAIENKRWKVLRVTVALDCGIAVNPLSIAAQFEGGLIFGMTQLLPRGAITLKDGLVQQRNFDGFTPPYIGDAPAAIDVHIVPSNEPPTGCGEPPVPVISPAVVNAIARLTGERHRVLPLTSL
jgi:isoquinoline 1-oxidoreductase beta subunit